VIPAIKRGRAGGTELSAPGRGFAVREVELPVGKIHLLPARGGASFKHAHVGFGDFGSLQNAVFIYYVHVQE